MTNEEKSKEIAHNNRINYYEGDIGWGDRIKSSEEECYDSAMEMAEWKDKQEQTKWHKIADGDFPKENGNYWCKLKGDYQQGSSHYKQHCKDGYCILQWLNKAKKWNVRYNTEVEAWMELPKYNE